MCLRIKCKVLGTKSQITAAQIQIKVLDKIVSL